MRELDVQLRCTHYKSCVISQYLYEHENIHSSGEAEQWKEQATNGHAGWQDVQLFHLKCAMDNSPEQIYRLNDKTSLVIPWMGICLPMQGYLFSPWYGKIPHAWGN